MMAKVTTLLDVDYADLIDEAVGHHRVPAWRDRHVAHDVAAAGNSPALEFFARRIEANDRVRLGVGFIVPDRALGEDHAIGFGLRTAWRRPFLHRTARKIELAEI